MIKEKVFNRMDASYDTPQYTEMIEQPEPNTRINRFRAAGQKFAVEANGFQQERWDIRFGTGDTNSWFAIADDDIKDILDMFHIQTTNLIMSIMPERFALTYDRDFLGYDTETSATNAVSKGINNQIIDKIKSCRELKKFYDIEYDPTAKINLDVLENSALELIFRRK